MNRKAIISLLNIDRRQAMTYIVIIGFMLVTIGHVANYTGSFEPDGWHWLGWLYALSVDVGIIVCAALTQWKTTRLAWPSYIILVAASGALNVAQVEPWLVGFGAWVYAILPTIAQALLGFLARDAGKFTASRSQSDVEKQLRAKLKELQAKEEQLQVKLARKRAMKEPKRTVYDELCANLDGNKPKNARAVNQLLNDCGYYSVPDSTARNWAAQ